MFLVLEVWLSSQEDENLSYISEVRDVFKLYVDKLIEQVVP